jgi:hypothetical protein
MNKIKGFRGFLSFYKTLFCGVGEWANRVTCRF